ncbi:TIGR02266 family protein [Myxococcota bacterium]
MNQNPQRRSFQRFPYVLRVDYPDRQEFFSEWTENLSAGGLFVRTERLCEPGRTIALSLSFPGLLEPVEIVGRVAWVREAGPIQAGGLGVEVTNEAGRRRLADLALRASTPEKLAVNEPFRVLVVEDNPRVTRSYERVLKHAATVAGGRVEMEFASDGHSALAIVSEQHVDLIITDIYMPIMDGFALIEQLRSEANTRDLPVIVITGGRADERQRAEALGVRAFLNKPVQFGQLLETIIFLVGVPGS